MKRKLFALLLAAALLTATGCALAQQSPGAGDRFVGFYVSYENFYPPRDMTGWVEYASLYPDRDFGADTSYPVLVGQKNEDGSYTFPGKEGRALFFTIEEEMDLPVFHNDLADAEFYVTETMEDGATMTWDMQAISTPDYQAAMEGVEVAYPLDSTSKNLSYEISGTLYINATYDQSEDMAQYSWNLYWVYQTSDGIVYLSEKSESSRAPGLGRTESITMTSTVNGERAERTTKVSLKYEKLDPLTALTVYQHSADGTLLGNAELPTEGELPVMEWLPGAAWAVVEEQRVRPNGEYRYTRTVCNRIEGETSVLDVILLDDDGTGHLSSLIFE